VISIPIFCWQNEPSHTVLAKLTMVLALRRGEVGTELRGGGWVIGVERVGQVNDGTKPPSWRGYAEWREVVEQSRR
jgi:hypothetical protein